MALGGLGISAGAYTYVVQRGDTLSALAQQHLGGPIWGANGGLQKILGLNPQIDDPHLILVGQVLKFPDREPLELGLDPPLDESSEAFRRPAVVESADDLAVFEFSRFVLGVGFLQSRLDATDLSAGGKSILGSSFTPKFSARWEQHWQGGTLSFLDVHLRQENFSTTSTVHTLSGQKPLLLGYGLGARLLSWGSGGALKASLALDQESFVRGKSLSEIVVDRVLVPKLQLEASSTLYQSQVFRIHSRVAASYLAPMSIQSYRTQHGYALGASLWLHHEKRKIPFFGGLKVNFHRQNTSISKQSYLSTGLVLGFQFDVAGESQP